MSVDLALAKAECRVVNTDHDARITQYLNSAKAWVENYTGKKLASGTVTQEVTAFVDPLPLYWGPDAADITVSYFDAADEEAEITTARIVRDYVFPPLLTNWPDIAENSVIVLEYTAGYTSTPADLDMAVLLYIREMFDNGVISDQAMEAIESLCVPYRIPTVR